MAQAVLIDCGPIVAALNKRDQYHEWARAHFEALTEPCLTCEAVLSESYYLLGRAKGGGERLNSLLERGIIVTQFCLSQHQSEMISLMRRYHDTPMSFADACLVRMAEINNGASIFTMDSDFETYRKNGREVISLMKPW